VVSRAQPPSTAEPLTPCRKRRRLDCNRNDRERRRHMSHLWTRHIDSQALELGLAIIPQGRGDKGLEGEQGSAKKFPPLFLDTVALFLSASPGNSDYFVGPFRRANSSLESSRSRAFAVLLVAETSSARPAVLSCLD